MEECAPSTQAIGTRLSELCHSDSESPANILGYIFDEETKRRMRKEDEEEDYLDDSESEECFMHLLQVGKTKKTF